MGIFHILLVQRLKVLLQQKRLGLVHEKGDVDDRHERLPALEQVNLHHVRFAVNVHAHVAVNRLLEEFKIRR